MGRKDGGLVALKCVVDKLCKSLWGKLWRSGGKVLGRVWESWFSTKFGGKVGVFHGVVEKFCRWICTWFNRVNGWFCTVSTALTITTIKNII